MPASVTDKFRKASGSTRPVVTSITLPKAAGATSMTLTSATGWNTTTGVDFMMFRRQLNAQTGEYEEVDGTRTTWTGELTGTAMANMVLQAGTEPTSGYAADGNTVVVAGPSAAWGDDLIDGILEFANQDGTLKTEAVQEALNLGTESLNGWNALGFAPNTVTYNGNRSYDLVFNGQDLTSTLSPGMRLRTTRTVAAPTQCASLNGSSQYFSKSSPAGMTFTDDFVAGAWVKVSSYAVGVIASRFDGTSGWQLYMESTGQIKLLGYNAGGANYKGVSSYQSLPLNKWVHVSAQIDMNTATTTATTNYVMFDGVDVPSVIATGGTNPTALALGTGAFQIGASNGASAFFPGKIAQAWVAGTKVTQANVRTIYSQGLTSSLISSLGIISAYSLSGSSSDLNTTNANNLTANGSATTTNADAPWGLQASGSISSTLDYCEVVAATFSTNTTVTVRVPSGNTIPTSGGVSAVAYSSAAHPYGMPRIDHILGYAQISSSATTTSGPSVVVPGLTSTVIVPSGGRRLRVMACTMKLSNNLGGASNSSMSLWRGSVGSGTQISQGHFTSAAANYGSAMRVEAIVEIPAGTQTFEVGFANIGGATVTLEAAPTYPAFILVEELQ